MKYYFLFQYGGNPVSCAIALAVMDVIEEEKLQENALVTGKYWVSQLNEIKKQFPIIGDVRLVKINLRYQTLVEILNLS